jgi:hypothetical protein
VRRFIPERGTLLALYSPAGEGRTPQHCDYYHKEVAKVSTFVFTLTRKQYFRVPARSAEDARETLENCDDLSMFEDTGCCDLDDLQPEFEFHHKEG